MVVLNNLDRYRLALDTIRHVPRLKGMVEEATRRYHATIDRHIRYVCEHGEDMPEIREWKWTA
jgi:xylulose-5-phosphate/fructose-6-phosphate phosphoketolase